MKLTYRDKVILAIVLAVAIFVGGFFGLIKPKRQAIKDNEATLENLEKEKKEIERKIERIGKVEDKITSIHSKSKKDTAIFVDADLIGETNNLKGGTTKLDQYMYDYAEEAHVKIMELKTDPVAAANIDYYYTAYAEVAGALRESADINGSLRTKVADESADSSYISARNVENIMSARYGVTVEGTQEEIFAYLKQIEDIDSAVIITSVSMSKAEDNEEKKATPAAPDGQPVQEEKETKDEDQRVYPNTLLDADIVIQLYSVYEMDEPNTAMTKTEATKD